MSETKHTPGPWSVEYDEDSAEHVIYMGGAVDSRGVHGVEESIRYDHGLFLHYEDGERVPEPEAEQFWRAEANARLIAAAPDLLDALKDCLYTLRSYERTDQGGWNGDVLGSRDMARAAIAKAEGAQGKEG